MDFASHYDEFAGDESRIAKACFGEIMRRELKPTERLHDRGRSLLSIGVQVVACKPSS